VAAVETTVAAVTETALEVSFHLSLYLSSFTCPLFLFFSALLPVLRYFSSS
jgi:hypothetical protein